MNYLSGVPGVKSASSTLKEAKIHRRFKKLLNFYNREGKEEEEEEEEGKYSAEGPQVEIERKDRRTRSH